MPSYAQASKYVPMDGAVRMNWYLAFWGGMVAAAGLAMNYLLGALGEQTFFMARYYIPPAVDVSYGVVVVGLLMLLASAFSGWPRYSPIGNEEAGRGFARLALLNAVLAAAFASAMLIPPLRLPILLAQWPGIYIVIAYGSFVGFGVIGMLCWALLFEMLPTFFSRSTVDRRSVILQLALSEIGVLVISTVLFLAGFRGASLVEDGTVGATFVGASMEFADIPVAGSIFLVMISVFLGAFNILSAERT